MLLNCFFTNEAIVHKYKYVERGEIRVDSPTCMKGYYKNEQATNEDFYQDKNIWGCTGDIGYADEDGEVIILGRAKGCYYTSGGMCIFQFDIENVILQDDSVVPLACMSELEAILNLFPISLDKKC